MNKLFGYILFFGVLVFATDAFAVQVCEDTTELTGSVLLGVELQDGNADDTDNFLTIVAGVTVTNTVADGDGITASDNFTLHNHGNLNEAKRNGWRSIGITQTHIVNFSDGEINDNVGDGIFIDTKTTGSFDAQITNEGEINDNGGHGVWIDNGGITGNVGIVEITNKGNIKNSDMAGVYVNGDKTTDLECRITNDGEINYNGGHGVWVDNGGITGSVGVVEVNNNGVIENNGGHGVWVDLGGITGTHRIVEFTNKGTIQNNTRAGVYIKGSCLIDNQGTISGSNSDAAVLVNGGTTVLRNKGTIKNDTSSNKAIYVGADSTLVVEELGTVSGSILGAGNSSTLEYNLAPEDECNIDNSPGNFGNVNVRSGKVRVNGYLYANVMFNILFGGGLAGNANLACPTFDNAGMVSPGNSIGTITVQGDYTQQESGILEIELDDEGNNDKLNVNGTATLGGRLSILPYAGSYTDGAEYAVVAATTVSGTFASVVDNSARFSFTPNYSTTEVSITLVQEATFEQLAVSTRGSAVAAVFDTANPTGDMKDIVEELDSLSTVELGKAFEALTPAPQSTNIQTSASADSLFSGAAEDFMAEGYSSNIENLRLAENDISASSDVAPTLTTLGNKGLSIHARTFYEHAEQGKSSTRTAYDYRTNGFSIGVDKWLNSRWVVGFSSGYVNTHVNSDPSSDDRIDGARLGLYAGRFSENWFVNAVVSAGFDWHDTERRIRFGAINRTAKADYKSHSLSGRISGGYDFKRGDWKFGPTAMLQVSHIDVDSFSEKGAAALNLSVSDRDVTSVRSEIGARVSRTFAQSWGSITPELHIRWQHEFKEDTDGISSTLQGNPTTAFTTQSGGAIEDSLLTSLGINAKIGERTSVFVRYDATFGEEDFKAQRGTIGIRFKF